MYTQLSQIFSEFAAISALAVVRVAVISLYSRYTQLASIAKRVAGYPALGCCQANTATISKILLKNFAGKYHRFLPGTHIQIEVFSLLI